MVSKIRNKLETFFDLKDDRMAKFEEKILGGIINGVLSGEFDFRDRYISRFISEFSNSKLRPIKNVGGESRGHKLVFVVQSRKDGVKMCSHLDKQKICYINGYRLLISNHNELPNCNDLSGRIFELPIEKNHERMEYIFNVLDEF